MDSQIEDFKAEAEEFVGLLEQLGVDDRDTTDHKDRAHRRFKFDSPEKTILLQIGDAMCALSDVSVGGLSFYSRTEFEIGKQLKLNFDDRFNVDVAIVNVDVVIANAILDEAASNNEETLICHGAEFVREGDGYKCTIAVLKYFLEIEKVKV